MFESQSLSLFSPKKDQCDVCCGFETKNISEETYAKHLEMKLAARTAKEKDKKRALVEDNLKLCLICRPTSFPFVESKLYVLQDEIGLSQFYSI